MTNARVDRLEAMAACRPSQGHDHRKTAPATDPDELGTLSMVLCSACGRPNCVRDDAEACPNCGTPYR